MRARGAPATFAIAALTFVVSVAIILLNWIEPAALWAGFIPARVSGTSYFAAQYKLAPLILTPLTATLVHGGFLHLGFNLFMLLFAGQQCEKLLGWKAVAVLYLVGAYASVAAQWLAGPGAQVPMIGASGAISALMGTYALLYGRSRAKAIGPIPARVVHVVWLAVAWTVLNLMIGIMSAGTDMPVAAPAHVGGFIAGLVLARPLLRWRSGAAEPRPVSFSE
ncbi:rhomboid family intramembrane serine protease [Stakelama marina]|uniref:Rhomboid family intramembrane serine protease n=1 Tax=Stakelama marina TaxID=2826939 RepID=A0A8T4IA17_9SPHN|nr:rhomboid family intramembrane serine protease [Stakelama marina]MBR0551497.1 rhomboid family intramembrane serine protease [Stakelama marina]